MVDRNNKSATALKKQSGLSLIEIMVALVIGAILIAGIAQIYVSNKQAYRLQESVSYINNNARFALFFLQDAVTAAGYKGNPAEADKDAFPAITMAGCANFNTGQYIAAATNVGADTGLLCVKMKSPRYSAGMTDIAVMVDCIGNNIAEKNTVISRFFISANGELSCGTSHFDETTAVTQALTSQPLVSDVTVTPTYGEDADDDKAVDPDPGTGVPAYNAVPTNWDNVIAVNFQVIVNSDADSTGEMVTVNQNQSNIANPNAPDNLLRRVITRTIALRSRTNPDPNP
ncbi:MAG: prepilin-type N-terminal cleavage/methylation domain-containing protein [Gammaproteobacteria bacterium]|nr:prepilin-type N-terminal cleavage/methylation domain-containing protein [Gammaproteobacteria bacterium]